SQTRPAQTVLHDPLTTIWNWPTWYSEMARRKRSRRLPAPNRYSRLRTRTVCVSCLFYQPLGNLGVQHIVELHVSCIQRAPCVLAGSELDLVLVQPVFVEYTTGKTQTKRWHVRHERTMADAGAWLLLLFA